MNMDNYYFNKYLKYKNKYLGLKREQIGSRFEIGKYFNIKTIKGKNKNKNKKESKKYTFIHNEQQFDFDLNQEPVIKDIKDEEKFIDMKILNVKDTIFVIIYENENKNIYFFNSNNNQLYNIYNTNEPVTEISVNKLYIEQSKILNDNHKANMHKINKHESYNYDNI